MGTVDANTPTETYEGISVHTIVIISTHYEGNRNKNLNLYITINICKNRYKIFPNNYIKDIKIRYSDTHMTQWGFNRFSLSEIAKEGCPVCE